MKYRKLRIALSALCTVLCVCLIRSWVQSYYSTLSLGKRLAAFDMTFQISRGELAVFALSPLLPSPGTTWSITRSPVAHDVTTHLLSVDDPVQEVLGFRF